VSVKAYEDDLKMLEARERVERGGAALGEGDDASDIESLSEVGKVGKMWQYLRVGDRTFPMAQIDFLFFFCRNVWFLVAFI
jgi:hypothetical protein